MSEHELNEWLALAGEIQQAEELPTAIALAEAHDRLRDLQAFAAQWDAQRAVTA
jgi:hypothetical protein